MQQTIARITTVFVEQPMASPMSAKYVVKSEHNVVRGLLRAKKSLLSNGEKKQSKKSLKDL